MLTFQIKDRNPLQIFIANVSNQMNKSENNPGGCLESRNDITLQNMFNIYIFKNPPSNIFKN